MAAAVCGPLKPSSPSFLSRLERPQCFQGNMLSTNTARPAQSQTVEINFPVVYTRQSHQHPDVTVQFLMHNPELTFLYHISISNKDCWPPRISSMRLVRSGHCSLGREKSTPRLSNVCCLTPFSVRLDSTRR